MRHYSTLFIFLLASLGLRAQTLSLAECRQMALQHNEQMQTADNVVRQAELDRQIAFTSYLPQIDGRVMTAVMKDNDMMGLSLQMRGTYMAGITLTQPIYVGGKITAANRLAAIGQQVSEEQRRMARQQLIADVDNAYYTLIAVREKVKMLEAYSRQMQALYDDVQRAVNAQMATHDDLLRITARQSETDYQLRKARNGEELCRLSLANVIGASFDAAITPADTLLTPAAPAAAISEDITARPDLHLLQRQVEVSEQQVKMARAGYLPQVAMSLGYSYLDNIRLKGTLQDENGNPFNINEKFNSKSPMAMFTLSVPIFHWGAEFKRVKKSKLDLANARLQLQQSERGMRIEVRQAVQNLTDGQAMLHAATLAYGQANESLRSMRRRYDVGMSTMTDLLDAQSQWQQARSNLIEAQTQMKLYETEYLRVTGQLD